MGWLHPFMDISPIRELFWELFSDQAKHGKLFSMNLIRAYA